MRGIIKNITSAKPNVGDKVYVEDLFEYKGQDIVFPALVLGVYDDCIIVEEQNDEEAIPEYLEKIQETRVWYEFKNAW